MSVFEDNDDYNLLKNALLKRIQKDPQNSVFTELLTWQFIQKKEFDIALRQTIALDRRLKEDGERVLELAQLFVNEKEYKFAIEAFSHLLAKGSSNRFYITSKVNILNAQNKLMLQGSYSSKELTKLEADYQDLLNEFGKNLNTSFAIRQLANLQAFYLNKSEKAQLLLEQLLQLPNLPPSIVGQTKLDLGDIYILSGEMAEAALIYGQVEKQFANELFGQEAKFRNAKLSYYQADFVWAKAQLDILKGSTSQLIANDALNLSLLISENLQNVTDTIALKKFAYADLLVFKNQPNNALLVLDSISQKYSITSLSDDLLMAKAKIFITKSDYQRALDALIKITENYSFDLLADDALFMAGDIYDEKLHDSAKAIQYFQKIITDFPGSSYVIEARKRFRNLRGDKIGSIKLTDNLNLC
jgi:tetratricopeptide (TPR) repeat protein